MLPASALFGQHKFNFPCIYGFLLYVEQTIVETFKSNAPFANNADKNTCAWLRLVKCDFYLNLSLAKFLYNAGGAGDDKYSSGNDPFTVASNSWSSASPNFL
jgi:hypothetical protein